MLLTEQRIQKAIEKTKTDIYKSVDEKYKKDKSQAIQEAIDKTEVNILINLIYIYRYI